MKKLLYHGSENIIRQPKYNQGAKTNDYGRGFYCTEEIELAREWACKKQKNGYVNKYELDWSELDIMNLNNSQYSILNWLALLADNRTYWQNGSIAQDFVSGAISMQKLAEAMRLGKLGEQVVLKSRRAFSKLCYLGEEMVDAQEYYMKRMSREREARREYRSTRKRSVEQASCLYWIL